jgi:transcriptional regulator with XRE-family HTH domain
VKNKELRDDLGVIGRRLRKIRQARRKPIEVIAGLAGISTGQLSELERGFRTPSIHHILALADALEISPSDLMHLPFPTPSNGHIDSTIQAVRLAVLGATHGNPDGTVLAVEHLRPRVEDILGLSWRCDQPTAVGNALPGLIRDLHTSIQAGRNVPELLDLAVMLHHHSTLWWLRAAGAPLDLRAQTTGLLTSTAQERGTPHALMLAASGATLVLVSSGATELAWATLNETTIPQRTHNDTQLAGSLALFRSYAASVVGRPTDVDDSLALADELATRTGQGNAYGLGFGPVDVAQWRSLALVEAGDYERAAAVSESVNLDAHPVRARQAQGWVTYARALAGLRGRQDDAVCALKRAETILPLEVQRCQRARDLLAQIVTKARHDAVGVELRRMVYRAGLTV